MNEKSDRLNQLTERIEDLENQHQMASIEIREIRKEIRQLKAIADQDIQDIIAPQTENENTTFLQKGKSETYLEEPVSDFQQDRVGYLTDKPKYLSGGTHKTSDNGNELEKFIGENLINKIGIIITVIGVAIGAKYAIEHQLISPLTRIILGYLFGLGMLGIAIRLKKEYENYSAVLLSGSIAILYFMTFAAYSFYQLIPQILAFSLMVLITIFTVLAAVKYNKPIIAHFGLVGAYAVPFLLGDNESNVGILFSYMAIINIGILVISFVKYWRSLYYSSFTMTWLVYLGWFNTSYQNPELFNLAFGFLLIFFLIFYTVFLAYKLRKNKKYEAEDILLLLSNSFIFYGLGYAILLHHEPGTKLLGLFTIGNSLIHFLVSAILYKQKLVDKNLLYLIFGLVLVYLTLSIPVQLDGNWVTLLWAGEAAVLFWIGRSKSQSFYEILSYPIMLLSFISLIQDWGTGPYMRHPQEDIIPLFNINFLTSLLFLAAFGFILSLIRNKKYHPPGNISEEVKSLVSFIVPAIFLITLYFSFQMEIACYFDLQLAHSDKSMIVTGKIEPFHIVNMNILKFKSIWLNNYTLFFLTLLSYVNIKLIKNKLLANLNIIFNVIAVFVFLIYDLYLLGELRDAYLNPPSDDYYTKGFIYIGIRYISLAFLALLVAESFSYVRQEFLKTDLKLESDILLHTIILWITSSELISWMDMAGSTQSYKLGLSILWGVYSLFLIWMGIWKKKKHLRIAAIVLFAGTLIKLFIYDISNMETISKTIVFVALGILLLIISFLYNKYRNIISEDVKN